MADSIENILNDLGPSVSSELAVALSERLKISSAAARQRLSRARGSVRRLAGIPFPRNARFMYLERQFGSPEYWNRLANTLIANNSALGYAIAALRQNGGMVPARQFPIVSGSPVRQLKHLSAATVLQRLTDVGLVKTIPVDGIGECVALVQDEEYYEGGIAEMRARLITEEILLSAVRDWLRKLGIASYNAISTRIDQKLPQVGTFVWDLSGPSYLGAVVQFTSDGKPKPGFVACDVNLASDITLSGAAPFIRKCATLRALRNVSPCIQILVADRFQKDALVALRSAGIIATTPNSLFGQDIADALRELTSVLTSAAYSAFHPEQFDHLFHTLGRISGATNQLRGALFEYMVADVVKRSNPGDVTMNRVFKVPDRGEAEIDVLTIQQNQRILAIECKGYSPRAIIPDDLFKRWLQHNVPTAYAYVRKHPEWQNLPAHFEFWTSAPISTEMLALFEDAKATIKPSRYTISLRGPKEVSQACLDTGEKSLIDAYNNHFTLGDGSIPPAARSRPPETAAAPDEPDLSDI
ncbi:NERD domain-containing protein [Marinicauda pacifica]|uniref:NERD domain-containing protein n=1 Tax=Marinicauda pacifica TaxID=1133559 RepID=UPI0035C82C09